MIRNEGIQNDELVKKLIQFKERMSELLAKSLERDQNVDLTIKNSFESFINENEKTAKSLVLYLHDQFKREFKNNTEVEISEKIDKIIQIFKFLKNKDMFESFYKASLAKRLLDSRRILEDAERDVIKKLKEECGFQFTQRLEVMFKDIKMSEQRMQEFKKSPSHSMIAIDFNVKVLTTGNWPNENKQVAVREEDNNAGAHLEIQRLPTEVKQCMSVFKQYYLSKFSGRQLNWKMNQGYAELKARIGNNGTRRYEMSVSTLQMCILTMFNDSKNVTYNDMLSNMQITDHDLKSHLIPLCKFKILDKSPKEQEFKVDDTFAVNFSYHNNSIKIKLPVISSKQQKS